MMKKQMKKYTIWEMVKRSAEAYGSICAMEDGNEKISYKKLENLVTSKATEYRKKDWAGKRIILIPDLSKEWTLVYIALLCAGVQTVIVEPHRVKECKEILAIHQVLDPKKESFSSLPQVSDSDWEAFERVEEEDTATLVLTSGTTGKPKVVVLSQKNLVTDAIHSYEMVAKGEIKPGDRTIPLLPRFHLFGIMTGALAPIYTGATMCMISDLKDLAKAMPKYSPHILFVVPEVVKTVMKKIQRKAKSSIFPLSLIVRKGLGKNLKIVVSGGAPLDSQWVEEYEKAGITLLNGYGITECSPVVTACSLEHNKPGSVGKINVTPFSEVKIADGTVHVRGDIVMKGYLEDDEVFDGRSEDGWFDTLDIGHVDEDGYLYITGREKNLIILEDGNNISPEELEEELARYPLIKECCVLPGKGARGTSVIVAMVVLDSEEPVPKGGAEAAVREYVDGMNQKYPPYKRINAIEIRESFEKTATGKIKRQVLEKGV